MSATTGLVAMAVAPRVDRVRACLADRGLDAIVVSDLSSIRWLTGFTGSNALVVVTAETMTLFTDGRYADQAPAQMDAAGVTADLVIGTDTVAGAVKRCSGLRRLGLEADTVTWAAQQRFVETGAELVPLTGLLVGLRSRKDDGELSRVRAAAAIADATLADVAPMMTERPTERDVGLALDHGMRRRGATAAAYETIVAAGPNGALPHARPTDRTIERGDLVVIDVGALVDGYRSDMTRTFVIGEPSREQQRQLDVVREAQAAGAAAVAAGVEARAVDAACREVIAAAGWADYFTHGTGHGVGIDIHEQPRINRQTADVLEAGQVVTVEPGVYLPGVGGVRWEDLLHVTPDGAEVLSGSPKDPLLL